MNRSGLAEVVASHHERAVVRVGDVYLKVDVDAHRLAREAAALAAAPVPVPEVLWARQGPPALLAVAAVAGRGLSTADPAALWSAAGRLARTLHDRPVDGWPNLGAGSSTEAWLDEERPHLVAAGIGLPTLDALTADLVDGLSGPAPVPVCLHGDFQPDHVFVDDGRIVGVIDWADATVGDPHRDLAVLTAHAPEYVAAVLTGYGPVDEQRLRAHTIRRVMGDVRWLAEHDYDHRPTLERLTTLATHR